MVVAQSKASQRSPLPRTVVLCCERSSLKTKDVLVSRSDLGRQESVGGEGRSRRRRPTDYRFRQNRAATTRRSVYREKMVKDIEAR